MTAVELLNLWERGLGQAPAQRALSLLEAACPGLECGELERLTVGQRDAHLAQLRQWTFGPRWNGVADCPQCQSRVELDFNLLEFYAPALVDPPRQAVSGELLTARSNGWQATFRLPGSGDLAAITALPDSQQARQALLQRCLVAVHSVHNPDAPAAQAVSIERLPDGLLEAIEARMLEADPLAEVFIEVVCPDCAQRWNVLLDVCAYFWSEIQSWAVRTLRDVHLLARAYGWSEGEILALSPGRRQAYLTLLGEV